MAKCLLESALNNTLLVRAKFTRAFLAQMLGLNVCYQYYQTDDPSFFQHKIKYTLDRDVTADKLKFTDTDEVRN